MMKMILYMEMMMMVYDESSLMMMMLNCKIKRQIISILGAANCHVYRGDRQGQFLIEQQQQLQLQLLFQAYQMCVVSVAGRLVHIPAGYLTANKPHNDSSQ